MEAMASRTGRASVRIWVVGLLALAWNAFGCFDFVMTNLRDPAYIAQLPPAMIDYIDALPVWAVLAWAMGVGLGLIGALALLSRSRHAVSAFAVSLLGLAATQAYQIAVGLPDGMNTVANWAMTAVIWIVAVAELLYTLRLRQRGILR